MAATYELGMNAVAYYEESTTGLANLDPLTNVKDVTVNLEAAEADITTRANSGWRATAASLRDASVDFETVFKPTDAGFDALNTAFLTGEPIEMAFLTGATGVADSAGPYGDWVVTNFSRSEPLEEAITVQVSVKMAEFKEWITDGVEAS